MSSQQNPKDDYVLPRNLNGRIRMNQQHFMYPRIFGYLLHPDIPRGENLAIADVGTGTGIWMLDAARELPSSTKFHGLDISLAQTPPRAWIPANIQFSELDLESPDDIPEHLQGAFDVVNLRLFVIVVKNNDPTGILRKLLRMLKPGGWLQWTDADMASGYTDFIKADPGLTSEALTAMDADQRARDVRLRPTWPRELGRHFENVGFEQVKEDRKTPHDFLPWLAFSNDVVMATYGEVIDRMVEAVPQGEGQEEKTQKLRNAYENCVAESWKGVAWNAPRVNVIGRKPTS